MYVNKFKHILIEYPSNLLDKDNEYSVTSTNGKSNAVTEKYVLSTSRFSLPNKTLGYLSYSSIHWKQVINACV